MKRMSFEEISQIKGLSVLLFIDDKSMVSFNDELKKHGNFNRRVKDSTSLLNEEKVDNIVNSKFGFYSIDDVFLIRCIDTTLSDTMFITGMDKRMWYIANSIRLIIQNGNGYDVYILKDRDESIEQKMSYNPYRTIFIDRTEIKIEYEIIM